jgi:hypothetical protein
MSFKEAISTLPPMSRERAVWRRATRVPTVVPLVAADFVEAGAAGFEHHSS